MIFREKDKDAAGSATSLVALALVSAKSVFSSKASNNAAELRLDDEMR
jgi:hypothetical protein